MPHELNPELRSLQQRIEAHAVDYGLDFFEIIYEVLDWEEINEVAAYGGYPARYPHWRYAWEEETRALCDPRVREAVAARGIELTAPSHV